jgi:hypothetical protein
MARTEQPAKKSSAAPAGAAVEEMPESLDKVRDILFGGQMRTVETRLQAMEERLLREQKVLRGDLSKQIAELDAYAKKEFQAAGERLAAERAKRADELKALAAELKEALRDLDKRHGKLQEATGASDAELRDQLLMHAKATAAEFAKTIDRMSSELSKSHDELMTSKTDSVALAALFTDVASRLGRTPAKNGKKG